MTCTSQVSSSCLGILDTHEARKPTKAVTPLPHYCAKKPRLRKTTQIAFGHSNNEHEGWGLKSVICDLDQSAAVPVLREDPEANLAAPLVNFSDETKSSASPPRDSDIFDEM